MLNITQDHLDWHGGFDAYAAAKGRIFGAQTMRVLNRDDSRTMALAGAALQGDGDARLITFGLNEPRRAGDYGLLARERHGLARRGDERDPAMSRPHRAAAKGSRRLRQPNITIKRLMPADALRIRGLHNAANALAALALARAIGLPAAPLLHGLREYRGEPHRVELIASIGGVDYIDDSKGTNVGATVAALDGLAQRAVLIAGGDGKGQDFTPLVRPSMSWCRAVMLIGRDAPLIRAAIAETGIALDRPPDA